MPENKSDFKKESINITQALVDEHVLVLKGLKLLKIARDKIEKNQHPVKTFFEKAIPFFQNYADKYHHYKEEFLMFGFLAQKKEGLMDLEIGSIRYQHETERKFLIRLEKSINGYAIKNEIAITNLLGNLSSFISILTRHIFREDNFFLPMIEQDLSIVEKKTFLEQFKLKQQALKQKKTIVNNLELLEDMEKLIIMEPK